MGTITIQGTAVEIYGDETGARVYLAGAIHGTVWGTTSVPQQQRALVTATRLLDRQNWLGQPTQPIDKTVPQPLGTQALQWPRAGVTSRNGVTIDDTLIPGDVIDAAYEIALDLIDAASTIQTQNDGTDLKIETTKQRVGPIQTERSIERFEAGGQNRARLPLIVRELLAPFIGGDGIAGVAFGADGCSTIEGADLGFSGYGLR